MGCLEDAFWSIFFFRQLKFCVFGGGLEKRRFFLHETSYHRIILVLVVGGRDYIIP